MDTKKFTSPFQLIGTRVKKLSLNNDFVALDQELLAKIKVNVDYTIESVEKRDEYIVGIITLDVKASLRDEEKKKVSISVSIEGCFISPPDTQGFENLLGINGCASLYSIARAYVLSISSQSFSGGHIMLPMINTITFHRLKKNEQQQM